MFVLVLAVPALLVVLPGYVVGHEPWDWIGGLVDAGLGTSVAPAAEAAGWVTGLRRRRASGDGGRTRRPWDGGRA